MKLRTIKRTMAARPTVDGAGVKLSRVFGYGLTDLFDPFLMMDHFGSDKPADYQAGFPWHPHRGIETVTYLLEGSVDHGDSLGNSGTIGPGDVQWMTAGSGIIHQEMPKPGKDGRMFGFQLWVNLPKSEKMCDPAYHGFTDAEIPRFRADGVAVKVICGQYGGISGAVRGVAGSPFYIDVKLEANARLEIPTPGTRSAAVYLYRGDCSVLSSPDGTGKTGECRERTISALDEGEAALIAAGTDGASFIFISGTPLHEPIAWQGPIVMNTQEELDVAFRELDAGSFVKVRS
jgi:quercetin 2,3-dioxygenase